MKHWWWLILLFAVITGCSTTQGVNKEIPMKITQEGNGVIYLDVTFEMASDTQGESGDAQTDPRISGSLYGPSAVDSFQEFMSDYVGQLVKAQSENIDMSKKENPTPPDPVPVPVPKPDGDDTTEPTKPEDLDDMNLDDHDIVAEAKCDKKISVDRIIQSKCVFDKDVSTMTSGKVLVQWSDGSKLNVPDVGHWHLRASDAAKWWPQEPVPHGGGATKPGTPSETYAPRGTKPTKVLVLKKK